MERRFARGANVFIKAIDSAGLQDVNNLLERYIDELVKNFQEDEAKAVQTILAEAQQRFIMIIPKAMRPPSAE